MIGSLFTTICAAIVVGNRFTNVIGSDDSVLPKGAYVATWVLIMMSGIFYSIGSAAFVRAMR